MWSFAQCAHQVSRGLCACLCVCVFVERRKGAKLSVRIKGIVVGDHFDWTLSIDFPPKLDDIVSGTWDKVKSHMHI